MSDLNILEQRLITALERIDYSLDLHARQGGAAAPDSGLLDAALDRIAALEAELAAQPAPAAAAPVPSAPPAAVEALAARLSDAESRLSDATREAARLAAANEDLTRANRALIAAASSDERVAATRAALEAEAESLRAARAAEIAQMGDVLAALESLLGRKTRTAEAPYDADARPEPGEVIAFDTDPGATAPQKG
ncbi:MAG: hypothetical protein Q4G24_04195 [Paracoccus sp. (in: a-proteobacteria)]|uniref:hypothetical protein n=1 Tax=Paracoccus sp. TaxID=267 RepID=UPI0026DF9D23|nr:hypothetical protein [Paracoccus sp. (in: a-proteobacteria)]MDO5620651.1 hypothetical protein [Paracoccus sp. (in: a-proteobacteria)]